MLKRTNNSTRCHNRSAMDSETARLMIGLMVDESAFNTAGSCQTAATTTWKSSATTWFPCRPSRKLALITICWTPRSGGSGRKIELLVQLVVSVRILSSGRSTRATRRRPFAYVSVGIPRLRSIVVVATSPGKGSGARGH